MKRLAIAILTASVLAGCDSSSSDRPITLTSSKQSHPTATTAGSFTHCQMVTGAYIFRVEGLPFTAALRRGIDGACKAAPPSANVAAVAQEAKDIATGQSP